MKQSKMIQELEKEVMKGNLNALTEFWERIETNGAPLVETIDDENVVITFIWKGDLDLKSVAVYGAFVGGDVTQNQLQPLASTNLWYKSYVAKKDVRLSYFYSLNDIYGDDWNKRWKNLVRDPHNPKTFVFPKDENTPDDIEKIASVLELSSSKYQPWIEKLNMVQKGQVIKDNFYSKLLDNERRIWIYLPSEYDKNKEYPLVLIFDGDMYNGAIPTPAILDNLIADKKIPPVMAVLIDNPQRNVELPCNHLYVKFLTDELLPDLRNKYTITEDPTKVVVGGSSYGGLAATYAGLKRSDVFGNVLSQSGSFWWKPNEDYEGYWLVDEYQKEQKQQLKFYMDVGIYEIELMTKSNRAMFKVLEEKGYDVQYHEFSGGHDYLCWRSTLLNGLVFLLNE